MLNRAQRINAMLASEAEYLALHGEYSQLKAGDRFTHKEDTWIVVQEELDAARNTRTGQCTRVDFDRARE